ncbi:hypothetical protein [Flavobacterium orientale]|uniref:Uncharacterized protein n=1 Tax=Flavobacterium orientale TaxID=1756020 RepID=A0A916Y7G9_9FLAO|nr:hypothetical protein [Flavobacterium orientale]GGD34042.1 hypothetical protein GCM10011343_25020 [Flavobacterium orientale]
MAKIIVPKKYLDEFAALDEAIQELNEGKIKLLFDLLSIKPSASDLEKMLDWELILVTVLDKQMAEQLNKISAYIPTLKFVVREDHSLFTLLPGDKKRRVWKER